MSNLNKQWRIQTKAFRWHKWKNRAGLIETREKAREICRHLRHGYLMETRIIPYEKAVK